MVPRGLCVLELKSNVTHDLQGDPPLLLSNCARNSAITSSNHPMALDAASVRHNAIYSFRIYLYRSYTTGRIVAGSETNADKTGPFSHDDELLNGVADQICRRYSSFE